jgi:hypothetical protein
MAPAAPNPSLPSPDRVSATLSRHLPAVLRKRVPEVFSARCPNCRSVELRSVGVRNAIEQAIHWILLPYRCTLCGRHLFLFRWLTPDESA